MRGKLHFFLLLLITIILILSGCSQPIENQEESSSTPVTSESISSTLNREQSLYFNCIAFEGLPSYSLTKILYEQPQIKENIVFEYTIYTDWNLIYNAVEKSEPSLAIVPFKMAIDMLLETDDYQMVGAVKGNSHVLLGASKWDEIIGSEIVIYDPSGLNGQFETTLERLEFKLEKMNIYKDQDYQVSYTQDLTIPNDDKIFMIEDVYLRLDAFEAVGPYLSLDESDDYQLALLIEKSIIEINPDIVSSFVDEYYRACAWISSYPERALAYSEQLKTTTEKIPARSLYYFDASKNIEPIVDMLTALGYDEATIKRIEQSIFIPK
ncbi:MAG TPA: hypothetical protein VLS94_07305 [Fusibacter sp.]|nr:hypothetical protein [Fusibacter sp.]